MSPAAVLAVGLLTIGIAGAPIPVTVAAPDRGGAPTFSWQMLESGSTTPFRGVDAGGPGAAWVAGSRYIDANPEVLVTTDGGASFTDVTPPEAIADDLPLKDIEAFGPDRALVLTATWNFVGSRIYRTVDGGLTWREAFHGRHTDDRIECMAFFDRRHGFAVGTGNSPSGFRVLVTRNAGRSWTRVPDDGMPDREPAEQFTSHSECATATGRKAFFGTSGGEGDSRIFRSDDFGQTWDVTSTSLPGFAVAGLDFRTNRLGLATDEGIARTIDGGASWQLLDGSVTPAGRSTDVAWWSDRYGDERSTVPETKKTVFVVAGSGSHVSLDRGKSWAKFDANTEFYSVDCLAVLGECWAAGDDGIIARLRVQ